MLYRKELVWITPIIGIFTAICLFMYVQYFRSTSFVVDERGAIILGRRDAKVELILFEDFQCSHCQLFTESVLPKIQSRYIDTGKVRCVLLPLPLFQGSKALSNAALTIFHTTPDLVFSFLKRSAAEFKNHQVKDASLLELASLVDGIDMDRLEHCIEERCYYKEIDKNLKQARKMMNNQVLVPTLYINRIAVSTTSFEAIAEEIERQVGS
jgi:protein-disulfide isomerase